MDELKVIYLTDIEGWTKIYLENFLGDRVQIYPLWSNTPIDLLHFAVSLADIYQLQFVREKQVVVNQVLEVKGPKENDK